MDAAGFGRSFTPIVQYEKWEIHKVFPHFSYFRLGQNLLPNLLAPLCGVAFCFLSTLSEQDQTQKPSVRLGINVINLVAGQDK